MVERREILLVAARVACTALAAASFAIAPVPSPGNPGFPIFLDLKVATIMQLGWGPMTILHHVGSVRHWPGMAPDDYYNYIMVTGEWFMMAVHMGVASPGAFIIFFMHYDLHVCGGSHLSICWRYEVSSLLACAMSLLSIIIPLTLNWARLRHSHAP